MIEHEAPQQLILLPSPDVPVRFRLDEQTRRRGLRHVAEIRRLLAERQAARADAERSALPRPVRSDAA
jgi:hypothetical protein